MDTLDTEQDLNRRYNLRRNNNHAGEFTRRFETVMTWTTDNRMGFVWDNNSCHLDTWLMEEFAMLFKLCSTNEGSLLMQNTLTGPNKDMPMVRLVKVLLALGIDGDRLKKGYWLMEIEHYNGKTPIGAFAPADTHMWMLEDNSVVVIAKCA